MSIRTLRNHDRARQVQSHRGNLATESDSTTMASQFQVLAEWVRSNGGAVHPSLGIERSPGSDLSLVVKHDAPRIEVDEELFSIPYCLTLSYLNAVSAGKAGSGYHPRSQSLPNEFLNSTHDHDAVAYVFLMQQYLLGDRSFWYP